MRIASRITVTSGFAPSGLVRLLKLVKWDKMSDFKSFGGVTFGGYVLTTQNDKATSCKYHVKVTEVKSDRDNDSGSFKFTAFGSPNFSQLVREGPVCILRHPLTPTMAEGFVHYTIDVVQVG